MRIPTLVFVLTALASSAAMADPPAQNCIDVYYVTDINGVCVGDLRDQTPVQDPNGGLHPASVIRNFKVNNSVTSYLVPYSRTAGIQNLVVFLYKEIVHNLCQGQAYIQLSDFPEDLAFADTNGTLWAPSNTGRTTILQQSFSFGGACYATPIVDTVAVAPAVSINTTLVHSLVPPSLNAPWKVHSRSPLYQ